jgi:acyl-coenzyme A thioesterase PaaI-like protein
MTKPPKLSDDAKEVLDTRGMGHLAERMNIELLELSAERAVARMPVEGNTQPLGILHGGAHVVIAEIKLRGTRHRNLRGGQTG